MRYYTDGSYNSYNYYEFSSSESDVLQDQFIKIVWTLPEDFSVWETTNAVVLDYRTETGFSTENDVEVYSYLSGCEYMDSTACGTAGSNPSSSSNASASWSTITIDDSNLDLADTAGEQLVIYVKLESYNDYYAQIGDLTINYLSKW